MIQDASKGLHYDLEQNMQINNKKVHSVIKWLARWELPALSVSEWTSPRPASGSEPDRRTRDPAASAAEA